MGVSVVNIREVPMAMTNFIVAMGMRMRLHAIPFDIVAVLVVFIVPMFVSMAQRGVLVFMDVALRQVQPDTGGHQRGCHPERKASRFPKQGNREGRPHKRGR